jgi:hypothetical protein
MVALGPNPGHGDGAVKTGLKPPGIRNKSKAKLSTPAAFIAMMGTVPPTKP